MTARGYIFGWLSEWDERAQQWIYADTKAPVEPRDCPLCGKPPTPEGYDACLGHIPGATSACCGHGVEPGHVQIDGRERRLPRKTTP